MSMAEDDNQGGQPVQNSAAGEQIRGPEAPDHLFDMELGVKSYQHYLTHLRKGGKSFVSEQFGSAEDLFSGGIEIPTPTILDVSGLKPESDNEFFTRALFFTQSVRKYCRDFLVDHIGRCMTGEFGTKACKISNQGVDPQGYSAAMKELICASIYLTSIEQSGTNTPEWLGELLGAGLSVVDKLVVGPPVGQIMERLSAVQGYKCCQKAATSMCEGMQIGSVGCGTWTAINEFLHESCHMRYDVLKAALSEPVQVISEGLAALR